MIQVSNSNGRGTFHGNIVGRHSAEHGFCPQRKMAIFFLKFNRLSGHGRISLHVCLPEHFTLQDGLIIGNRYNQKNNNRDKMWQGFFQKTMNSYK